MTPIARVSIENDRCIPAITKALYQEISPQNQSDIQNIGLRLIQLINTPLSGRQRYAGSKLNEIESIARLLILHHEAIQAEYDGSRTNADHFWTEIYYDAKHLYTQPKVWESLHQAVNAGNILTPQGLRDRVYLELLVDTHIAFANGYKAAQGQQTRTNYHIEKVKQYLKLVDADNDTLFYLFHASSANQLKTAFDGKVWTTVIDLTPQLLKERPNEVAYKRARSLAIFINVMGKITDEKDLSSNLRQATELGLAINTLKQLSEQDEHSMYYDYLAVVEHQYAVKLANCGKVTDALIACYDALTYNPMFLAVYNTEAQIRNLMKQMTDQLNLIRQQIRLNPRMQLTPEGKQTERELSQAESRLYQHKNDAGQKRISERVLRLRGDQLWNAIGFGEDQPDTPELRLALNKGFIALSKKGSINITQVGKIWADIITDYPELAQLDRAKVETHIIKLIFSPVQQNQQQEALFELPTYDPPQNPPLLKDMKGQNYAEAPLPYQYWLYGHEDRPLKIGAVAGVVFLFIAFASLFVVDAKNNTAQATYDSALATHERNLANAHATEQADYDLRLASRDAVFNLSEDARNTAYQSIVTAVESDDYLALFDAAEIFLENPSPSGIPDKRYEQVVNLYQSAIVLWAVRGDADIAEVNAQITQFETLTGIEVE